MCVLTFTNDIEFLFLNNRNILIQIYSCLTKNIYDYHFHQLLMFQSTTKEETSNATVSNEEQTESSNFQACLEDSSFSTADDFEHVEAMFSTLMENPQHDSQETIPLSNELRRAITNMEDIDDVCYIRWIK